MAKEDELVAGGCSAPSPRPRRIFARFSLRRLLYASPLIGRRISRMSNSSNRNSVKGKNLEI